MMTKCTIPECSNMTSGGLQMICESCRQARIEVCRPHPTNQACGYYAHTNVNDCSVCASSHGKSWDTKFDCKPCDKCHWCGEVHQAA